MSGIGEARVYGTETEYGLIYNGGPQVPANLLACLPHPMMLSPNTNKLRVNGSKIYIDVGSHPEYASAEAASLDNVAASEIAGDEIYIKALAKACEGSLDDSYRLHKRAIDNKKNNYGAHVSYNVAKSLNIAEELDNNKRDYLVQALAVFNVSRLALFGSGFYDTSSGKWHVSQRAHKLIRLHAPSAQENPGRPIVDTRNEPLSDRTRYARLHDSSGDPSISVWALRGKIGMTSAFIRLLENDVPLDDLLLQNPIRAAAQIATDTSLSEKFELRNGHETTALEILSAISERILDFEDSSNTVPDDELAVVKDVLDLSAMAAQDTDCLIYKSDWKTRQFLAETKTLGMSGDKLHEELSGADMAYDLLAMKRPGSDKVTPGIGKRLREQGQLGPYDQALVDELQISPPNDTRAYWRGRLLQAAENSKVRAHYGSIQECNWDVIKFVDHIEKFQLLEPLRTPPTRAIRYILEMAGISYEE